MKLTTSLLVAKLEMPGSFPPLTMRLNEVVFNDTPVNTPSVLGKETNKRPQTLAGTGTAMRGYNPCRYHIGYPALHT